MLKAGLCCILFYALTGAKMRAAGRHVGMQEHKLCLCPPPVPEECERILPSCDTADSAARMDPKPVYVDRWCRAMTKTCFEYDFCNGSLLHNMPFFFSW